MPLEINRDPWEVFQVSQTAHDVVKWLDSDAADIVYSEREDGYLEGVIDALQWILGADPNEGLRGLVETNYLAWVEHNLGVSDG